MRGKSVELSGDCLGTESVKEMTVEFRQCKILKCSWVLVEWIMSIIIFLSMGC